MSNALWVAWRIPCSGLRSPSVLPPVSFRPTCRNLRMTPWSLSSSPTNRPFSSLHPTSLHEHRPSAFAITFQQFPHVLSQRRLKRTTAAATAASKATESLPGERPRSDAQIKSIFASKNISTRLGNRTLAVLQNRRVHGTLDLDLPSDIIRGVPQLQLDTALQWLRQNYPIDEDAAILARIEREEYEAEQKLVRRAEQLGLYKPQSGSYGAELGEDKSVYGKSVLKEAREKNEKRLLAEKEHKRQQWLEGENEELGKLQRQVEGNTTLQKYQEAALTEGMWIRVCWNLSLCSQTRVSSTPSGSE